MPPTNDFNTNTNKVRINTHKNTGIISGDRRGMLTENGLTLATITTSPVMGGVANGKKARDIRQIIRFVGVYR